MLGDAGSGNGARALRTRSDAAHWRGSSGERGEPARAPRGSVVSKVIRCVLPMRTSKGAENQRFWLYAAPFLD